jgi:hypothetical protein
MQVDLLYFLKNMHYIYIVWKKELVFSILLSMKDGENEFYTHLEPELIIYVDRYRWHKIIVKEKTCIKQIYQYG